STTPASAICSTTRCRTPTTPSCRCSSCSSRLRSWSPSSPATWSSRGWIRAPGRRGEAVTGLLVSTGAARRSGARVWTAIRRSPKAAVGLALFGVFCLLAAFPQLFTSVRHPNELAFLPTLPPSSEHLLGTTTLGQDIWAQLVYGTRQLLVI